MGAEGHAVRGTTRDPARRAAIEAAGAEPYLGDPDRIATLTSALDGATILCWLLGSARGPAEAVRALHTTRLSMLLARTIDTTVRGVVYEAAGSVPTDLLLEGAVAVAGACEHSSIPFRLLDVDPDDHDAWLAEAVGSVRALLAG